MNDTGKKIKKIFVSLKPNGKDNVRKFISDNFNVSVDSVKNHWIHGGNTPSIHQEEVLEILSKELEKQVNDDSVILKENKRN